MKAITVESFGDPENYILQDKVLPSLKANEVRVAIMAAGVSLVDVLVAQGKYQVKPPLPYVPGTEFSGVVEEIGSAVNGLSVGDRVLGGAMGGGYAEKIIIPAHTLVIIPDAMSYAEASVFRISYLTAYYSLCHRGAIKTGETVLVLGAAGAIGSASIQVAKAMGAKVIASASSDEKREFCLRSGADIAIDSTATDWRDQVKRLTLGKGVDIVVDPVGHNDTERAFRSLAWNGRHLVVGFAGGDIPALPTNLALLKGASLIGVDVRQLDIFEPQIALEIMQALFEIYKNAQLKPSIELCVPFENFREALNARIKGDALGRIVLSIGTE